LRLPRIAEPLRHRDFRLLWVGQTLTLLGSFISQVALPFHRIRRAGIAMYLFAALGGVALLVYGLVPSVPGALAASVILGLSFVSFGVLWESALQRHVPRALLGRVTSVDWFGGNLLGPVAPLGAALIANAYGPAAVFLVGGAIATGLCLAALALPSIRRLE